MLDKYYLEKEDALLLIIDIQERLLPVMDKSKNVLKNAKTLVQACGISELPMVVTEQYPKGLGKTVDDIKDELSSDAEILEKLSFSACGDELMEVLKKKDRKKIIVAGIESHICVFQTVRDLLNSGYEVYAAADAMGSRSDFNYRNALELMKDMGAVIMSTEMIIYNMLKKAGSDEFKKVSKIVK